MIHCTLYGTYWCLWLTGASSLSLILHQSQWGHTVALRTICSGHQLPAFPQTVQNSGGVVVWAYRGSPQPTDLLYCVASVNHRLKQSIIYRHYQVLDCCNKAIKGAGTWRGKAEESQFSDCCTEYLYIHTYIGILHEWWCGTRPESQKKVHTIRLMGSARNKEMV
jgi:hypothetical protein